MLAFYLFDEPKSKISKLDSLHLKIIKNIVQLIQELNLDNIHEIFYIYCYLLWNGYFSLNKTYVYSYKDILDENNTIFLGEGCCRHNAKLLEEVLRFINIFGREIGVRLIKAKIEDVIDIERKEKHNEPSVISSGSGCNHSVTLAQDGNGLFLLDPTNLLECEIIKKSKLKCLTGKFKIDRKLFSNELDYNLYYGYKFNRVPTLDKNKLINTYNKASDICQSNIKLFDEFHDDNHRTYEKVKELILK